MAEAKRHLEVCGDFVVVFTGGEGHGVHHSELIDLMAHSRSLAEVRERFAGSRSNLIETLKHFGYDFDALLQSQFREGYRDTALAKLHRVDPKWIARKREALGFPNSPGRSRVEFSSEQVRIAYDAAGSFAGAARLMGIDRQTFKKLYAQALEKMEPGNDGNIDQSPGNDRFAKARAETRRVGHRVCYSEDELKKFFDDEWGES
ncbi:hypothetical protein [Meridianimarinicoccus aquatilis]|uniref:Uncharacterized protein n=1 Tax=Meridianimarinicoccus aquatilis TaxID=2552766 RepID=A0A4R6AUB2_9RHOB|nr:hypothetical protein [Fluviibacterium aquatile]TDL87144.1 hypothetical protein E2L05_11475 [Fluviibacterium aquatile]